MGWRYLSWKVFILPVNILSKLRISWYDQACCISLFVKSDMIFGLGWLTKNMHCSSLWWHFVADIDSNMDLRRPDPPAMVIARQAMIAFQGWVATSSPYLWATKIRPKLCPRDVYHLRGVNITIQQPSLESKISALILLRMAHHKKKRWSDPVTPFWHSRAENYGFWRLCKIMGIQKKTSHQISVLMCGSLSSHCSWSSFSSPEDEKVWKYVLLALGTKWRNMWSWRCLWWYLPHLLMLMLMMAS